MGAALSGAEWLWLRNGHSNIRNTLMDQASEGKSAGVEFAFKNNRLHYQLEDKAPSIAITPLIMPASIFVATCCDLDQASVAPAAS